uniref:Uncharacterized protein n=1 Tax=Cajanus cajan TaxID=3821 RepID=A0A151UFY0_CAJCA
MGSVAPYSVGTCLPSLRRLPSLQPQTCNNHSESPPLGCHRHVKCTVQVQPQAAPPVLNRRTTLISLLALDAILSHSLPQQAPAAEAPCQFKVASSGLAFCDKLLGTGPEAVKGQLIKVFSCTLYIHVVRFRYHIPAITHVVGS